jgi:hypothetical protein
MTDQDEAPGKGFPVMVPECGRAIEPGPIAICEPCAPRGACIMAPVVIPPADPARDARVAARRAADARRAGRALDRLIHDLFEDYKERVREQHGFDHEE